MRSEAMIRIAAVILVFVSLWIVPAARAGEKIELFGIVMSPTDLDARQYGGDGIGAGVEYVHPLPGTYQLLGVVFGAEAVNLLSEKKGFQDALTGLRVEQQTSQNYGRLFLGAQLGSHSSGFLRPYAGLNLAGVWYGISVDVVVPNDANREAEIRQNLRSKNVFAFGWDANGGVDFNFRDRWSIDLGARLLHSYGVPQQLGAGAVTIQPSYVQYRVGIALGPHAMANP